MLGSENLYGTDDPRRTSLEAHDQLAAAYPCLSTRFAMGRLYLHQGWLTEEDEDAPQQVSSTNTKGSTSTGRVVSQSCIVDTEPDAVSDYYELLPTEPEFSTAEQDTHKPEPVVLEEEDASGHTIPLIEVNLT